MTHEYAALVDTFIPPAPDPYCRGGEACLVRARGRVRLRPRQRASAQVCHPKRETWLSEQDWAEQQRKWAAQQARAPALGGARPAAAAPQPAPR